MWSAILSGLFSLVLFALSGFCGFVAYQTPRVGDSIATSSIMLTIACILLFVFAVGTYDQCVQRVKEIETKE